MADRAYVELRDQIVTLRIAPGAPINEDALGREFEIGPHAACARRSSAWRWRTS